MRASWEHSVRILEIGGNLWTAVWIPPDRKGRSGSGRWKPLKLTTFVTDISQLQAFRTARDQFLDPAHLPASTLVQVARLFRPEFLIEIEALAVR